MCHSLQSLQKTSRAQMLTECRKNMDKFTENPEERCEHFWLNFTIFLSEALTQMLRKNGFILFQYPQLEKGDKSFQFVTCEGLLCFLPDTGEAGKWGLHLLQNLDNFKAPYELLSKVWSWKAEFAKPKGTWESHHCSGQSPSLVWVVSHSHSLCTRHERMSPSLASWTNCSLIIWRKILITKKELGSKSTKTYKTEYTAN